MTSGSLERWVTGDKKHDMQAFALGNRVYGFGYASQDDVNKDERYDPGFQRRENFVREKVSLGNKHVFEYNFWADKVDEHFPKDNTELRHDTTLGWTAKHLFSLFEQRALREGDPNDLAFFMSVEKSDFKIDGRILNELGFQAINKKGVDYNNPKKPGDDTLFCLTFDNFARALERLDKKMSTPPRMGQDSKMFIE